jgi:hypothetical protein
MSEDIVKRLREYAEEWQIDRSVVDRAADEIIRLRALVEASVLLAQPGALTVNCVRGTVSCQEAERLRARVAELERQRPSRVLKVEPFFDGGQWVAASQRIRADGDTQDEALLCFDLAALVHLATTEAQP